MKLKFLDDKYVDGKLAFKANEVYEISDEKGSATRWLKRGAVKVEETKKVEQDKAESNVLEKDLSEPKEEKPKAHKSKKQV